MALRRSAVRAAPRPMSEAEFQRAVVALARSLGWGVAEATWRKQNEEAAFYARLSADVDAVAPLEGLVFHPHFSVGSESGWPDLVLVRRRDRRFMLRELKSDAGVLRPRQRAVLDLLSAVGLDAGVWRPGDMGRIAEELR